MERNKKHQIKTGNPEKMGAVVCENGINFTVEIPRNQEADLLLYEKNKEQIALEIPFTPNMRIGDVGSLFLQGISPARYEYAYRIGGKIMSDPYGAVMDGERSGFASAPIETSLIANDRPWISYEEMILYKLHVRGFTKQAHVKKKGTFAGVEERIPYLKELGINAVEFMPMYEWDDSLETEDMSMSYSYKKTGEPLKNYWGYAAKNYYFAPKTRYAAGKDPAGECRRMIQAMHEAGLECIMEFFFPAGTKPALALDALCYWKMHYGVDGFHLIGPGVPVEPIVHYPLLKKTKLFFDRVDEGWLYGNEIPAFRNLAEYNNDFMDCARRLLKGDDSQVSNFVSLARKKPPKHGVVNYMANVNGFTMMDMVSYDRKHNEANGEDNQDGMPDNDTWNCGAEGPSRKRTVQNLRKKQIKNAMLYTLLAQGTPLLYQGDECGNSQNGNNNAYAMDNETGWVNWKSNKLGKELFAFTREAIAFRKAHPILHMEKEMRLMDYKTQGFPDLSYHDERAWYSEFAGSSRGVGCMYCGKYASTGEGTTDDFIYIAYNAYWEKHAFALPKLPEGQKWQMAIHTDEAEGEFYPAGKPLLEQRSIEVSPRTVVVLLGK